MFDTILSGIHYVISAPFFYYGVSGTIVGGIWIGASIYEGNLRDTWKGMLTVLGYCLFLILTTVPRILNSISSLGSHSSPGMEYAGIITIGFIVIYYVLGMLLGVYTIQRARRKNK